MEEIHLLHLTSFSQQEMTMILMRTQLKACLKRARIPLQLQHNAQANIEGIVVDLGRLFKM